MKANQKKHEKRLNERKNHEKKKTRLNEKEKSLKRRRERDRRDVHVQSMFTEAAYVTECASENSEGSDTETNCQGVCTGCHAESKAEAVSASPLKK